MAIITKIRQRSGLAIGIIAVGLMLFVVGGDLLSPNSSILQAFNKQIIGEIAGTDITLQEFNEQLNITKARYVAQLGRQPLDNEMEFIRVEAFNELIYRFALQKEFDKLGLLVTNEEIKDMVQGNNIHPGIAQSFTNQETGEVDRNQIIQFLKMLPQMPPEQQASFYNFEASLGPDRLRQKYRQLFTMSNYATRSEAEAYHKELNSKRDLRFLLVPFTAIPDSLVKFTDSELRDFFNKNKQNYERKANRSIEYVSFPFFASSADTANLLKEIETLKEQFASAEDPEAFANANSDSPINVRSYKASEIPDALSRTNIEVGGVYGPFLISNGYVLYRYIKSEQDTVFSARASHILFKYGEDKNAARTEAARILEQLKKGADFATMAGMYGQDGTSSRGGDLGWFPEGQMVAPFEKAVMSASQTGLLPNLVETEFGYHIIKVTGVKSKTQYRIASIVKEIYPSQETRNMAYNAAGEFATARNAKEYVDRVTAKENIISYQALTIPQDAKNINNLTGTRIREIVRWAYNDAKVGEVSDVFELDDQYIVCMLRGASDEGIARFEDVKEEVTADFRKHLKTNMIMEKMAKVSGSLEDMKKAYGAGAELVEQPDITLLSSGLRIAGFSPNAIGRAFGLPKGGKSQAFADENGVFVIEVVDIDDASEIADYNSYKRQLAERRSFQIDDKILKAIKKITKTKEQIAKYY